MMAHSMGEPMVTEALPHCIRRCGCCNECCQLYPVNLSLVCLLLPLLTALIDASGFKTGRMEGPENVCQPGLQDSMSAERESLSALIESCKVQEMSQRTRMMGLDSMREGAVTRIRMAGTTKMQVSVSTSNSFPSKSLDH